MDSSLLSISECKVNLANLPDEIFKYYLFNYLDLNDVWNLRLVCKKFYFIVNMYRIEELCLIRQQPVKLQNRLDCSKQYDLLVHPSKILINLKYLKIDYFYDIKLEVLNKYTKLQILEIMHLDVDSNDHLQL